MSRNDRCHGTVRSTGLACSNRARDIHGFCHRHSGQSQEYGKIHPQVVFTISADGKDTYIRPNQSATLESLVRGVLPRDKRRSPFKIFVNGLSVEPMVSVKKFIDPDAANNITFANLSIEC